MILRFRCENFRSLKSEQELSLVATGSAVGDHAVFDGAKLEGSVLPLAAIYGANASGKTNVLRALHFFVHAIEDSQTSWKLNEAIWQQPFGAVNSGSCSTFELDFLLDGERYSLGFCLNTEVILKEWLYTYPHTKRQVLYEREGQKFVFGKNLGGNKRAVVSLVRPNSLFISAAAQNNHDLLSKLYRWLSDWIIINDDRDFSVHVAAQLCEDTSGRDLLMSLIKEADLGIKSARVEQRNTSPETLEIVAKMTLGMPEKMKEQIRQRMIDRKDLSFDHSGPNGEIFNVKSSDESRGTINYIGLMAPVMSVLERGGVLIVDELNESLHPALVKKMLALFTSKASNPKGAQCIFNTHDTNLLDLEVLRRDEIWFTEKDNEGATHLYPLTDYKPRKTDDLEKGYLKGRYGAIPFVGDLTLLLSE